MPQGAHARLASVMYSFGKRGYQLKPMKPPSIRHWPLFTPSQQAWIESLVQSQLSATAGPTSGAATAPTSSAPITSYSPASSGTTGDEPAPAFTPFQQKWLEDFFLSRTPPRPPAPGLIPTTSSIPGMCVKLHKLH